MKIGHYSACHQMYERSFTYKGYQFPICARCTGIFIGEIIGIILMFFGLKVNVFYSIILLVPMIIDGSVQLFNIKESNNIRRVITGFIAGIAYINLLVSIVETVKYLVMG